MSTVSVIIPAHNRADLVGETLASVLAQSHRDLEVIVVDDGSTDETRAAVEAFGDRVRYVHQENRGVSSARNHGLRLASGDHVAFIDADDLWREDKLERQLDHLARDASLAWVYCDMDFFGPHAEGLPLYSRLSPPHEGVDTARHLIHKCFIGSPTPLVRRSVFEETGGFNEDIRFAEDWEMWLRIAASHRIGYVPAPLARYRLHGAAVTHETPPATVCAAHCRVVALAGELRPDAYDGKTVARSLARIKRNTGSALLKSGDTAGGRQHLRESLGLYALDPVAWSLRTLSLLGGGVCRTLLGARRGPGR